MMRASDIFCLSSISEGFPKVVWEALACGLPVVATDVGDIRRTLGESVTIVPPANACSLAEALGEVSARTDEAVRGYLSEQVADASWEKIVSRLDQLYSEKLGAKQHDR